MDTLNPAVAARRSSISPGSLRALETCDELARRKSPNFLRVVFNPWVAQTCLVLDYYARRLLRFSPGNRDSFCPSFLANSVDEALSGAVKLARFNADVGSKVLVVDPENRFPHFGFSVRPDGTRVEYIPDVERSREPASVPTDVGVLVVVGDSFRIAGSALGAVWDSPQIRTIRIANTAFVDQPCAADERADIAVLDESFVNGEVPLSTFTSRRELYEKWMQGPRSMFHSTTFQPNAITTKHFMSCFQKRDPAAAQQLNTGTVGDRPTLARCEQEVGATRWVYERLYSPSLSKLIRTIGFDSLDVTAEGHCFTVGGRPVLDGVAGVACGLRGHNPSGFSVDVRETLENETNLASALTEELAAASGLSSFASAVSGGAAVEHALKLALHAQSDRNHVLALKGGFGGKTLFALTGTERLKYKENIGPLYRNVTYVNPFADDALEAIQHVLSKEPIGVVQLELIQGVGGVRPIPEPVVRFLDEQRSQHDYLLLIDEVQTGMFRTGPFLRSHAVGISPDLVTIGKGVSDMMFPFGGTLFSDRIRRKLEDTDSDFADWVRNRYNHPIGQATLLNSLRRARDEDWVSQVEHQGERFETLLREGLSDCTSVADVRVFGMLIGIELHGGGSVRLLGKRAGRLYSLAMLQHAQPLLMGFCQYQPNIFKLTPSLLMSDETIETMCKTICESLRRSPVRVLAAGLRALAFNGNGERKA